MGILMSAEDRAAIREHPLVYAFCIAVFGFLFYHVAPTAPLPSILVGVVFGTMIAEDMLYTTVDVKLSFMLLGIFAATFLSTSISWFDTLETMSLWFIKALLFFEILWLATVRDVSPSMGTKYYYEDKKPSAMKLGALPSFGIGVLLFLGNMKYHWISGDTSFNIYSFIINIDASFDKLFVPIALVWLLLEARYRWKLHKGKILRYGFGDGDVLVLAIWSVFLSFGGAFVMFAISIIIQFAIVGVIWILNRRRMI